MPFLADIWQFYYQTTAQESLFKLKLLLVTSRNNALTNVFKYTSG